MTKAKLYFTEEEPEDIEVLEATNIIVTGIVTASSFVSSGSTAAYVGINTSTIDSNDISVHYMSFDTTSSAINISNFGSGKKTELIIRNSSGVGARNVIIRTSTTPSSHQAVPTIVHSSGTITNGTVSIPASSGLQVNIFNVNGTVVGTY